MGFLDRLFGTEPQRPDQYGRARSDARSEDEIALERYRYLMRTAPPEQIEQAHQEAFARLTPAQRDMLFQSLTESAPSGDGPRGTDAHSLAQSATRSELRQPGTVEVALQRVNLGNQGGYGANYGGGPSFGSMFASSLLGSVAGYVIGSAVMSAFMPAFGDYGDSGGDTDASGDSGADASADGGDYSGGDYSGGDYSGGDFGGGDFGGGDFGGGDFF
jgi:hypothetical protein